MQKIGQDNQPNSTHEFVARFLAEYAIKEFTFMPATTGIENTTLIVEAPSGKKVLRIYRRGKKEDQHIAEEVAFMNRLLLSSIPVPSIMPNQEGNPVTVLRADGSLWQAVLMPFIAGRHPQEYSDQLIRELATLQARVHLIGRDYAAERGMQPLLEMQTYLTDVELASVRSYVQPRPTTTQSAFIRRALSYRLTFDPSFPIGFNHLDMDAGNILVEGQSITAILDFDDLAATPLVECLGNTLWHVLYKTKDVEKLRSYMRAYEKVRGLSVAERSVLRRVMGFRNYLLGMLEVALWGKSTQEIDRYIALEATIEGLELIW